jgi:hypothetical protein
MICALTVRKLKPGTFDQFHDAFMEPISEGNRPEKFVRFDMIRNASDPDEVVTFGFFDGSMEEMRASMGDDRRGRQQEAIAPYVESVGADGVYEVVEEFAV